MTTMTDFIKVDGTDYPLAEYINKLFASALRAEFKNTETITGAKQLTDNDTPFQLLTASGGNQDVKLAAEATTNHVSVIYNAGGSNNLVVKDDSGVTTFATLTPGTSCTAIPLGGTAWTVFQDQTALKSYFDTLYSALDIITATEQGSIPSTPATGDWKVFFQSGGLYLLDDTGAVHGPFAMNTIMPMDSVSGLTLSNSGVDAANDIVVDAGRVMDGGGTDLMILANSLTKQLDAAWAVGNNAGGLDTGTKANSTWYHVWLIKRVDTAVVDVLFSTSATSPTMPTNYTKKRRIGAIKTDGAGAILAFLQYEDNFLWLSPPALDVNTSALGTSRVNYTLASVPSGVVVKALMNVAASHASAGGPVYISNPNLTDLAPSQSATPIGQLRLIGPTAIIPVQMWMFTDTSAQISARSSSASTTLMMAITGWVDPRGKR